MLRCLGRSFALLAFFSFAAASLLFSQAVSGSIFGTVTDNTNAPVPGATVTVTDVAKGTAVQTVTNESGNYTVTRLIPDIYRVSVEAKGFERFTQDNVTVNADQGVKVDAGLKIGRIETTVEVTSAPPLLKTDRADVSDTITTYDLVKMPVTNRNFTDLELTLPGAVQLGWQHASSENPQGSAQIQVNGQQFSSTDYLLDGTDNRDPILGIIVINPNLDAVQEVKMTTTDFDAEFGSGAAIMGAQTKSGTNQFHGTAFDYVQNNRVNARDPFAQAQPDPASGKLVPPLRYNQFGVTGGGAIIKDKLFYFGDYQGVRRNRGASLLSFVPTAAERGGDFSSVLGSFICSDGSTSGTACASPLMVTNQQGVAVPAQQNMIFDPSTGNPDGTGRQVFSFGGKTNVIDPARFDKAAVGLLNLLPAPNLNNGNPTQDYSSSGSELFHQNGLDTRIDYSVNGTNQLFGRYSLQQFFKSAPGAFGVETGGPAFPSINFAGLSHVRNQSMALGYDHTFSPTLLSDFRFGFFRYRVNVDPNGLNTTPASDAGAPGLNTGTLFTSAMPAFYINNTGSNIGSTQMGYALGVNQCNCPLRQNEVQLQWVGNITKIVGNHQIKWGADIRHADQLRVPSDAHRAGEVSFNQSTTGINDPNGFLAQTGEGFASYLLGLSGGMTRYVSTSTNAAERQNRLFFYGQDTYRFTPKITINYGLRWEQYRPQYVNGKGQGGWFDFSNANIMVAGVGPINLAGNVKPSYKQFAPRIGIAWQAREHTVVRVGYGRSYDVGVFGSLFGHTVTQNLPVLAFQNVQAPNSFQPAFTLSAGPPSPATLFAAAVPNPATGEFPLPDGVNVNADERQIHVPSVDSWNLTVEQQFGTDMVVDLSYLGNVGHHLTQTPDFNQHPILTAAQIAAAPNANQNYYRPWAPLGIHPASIPLPDSGVSVQCNCDSNNYHALQARFNKKLSHGYDVFSNYTWSKAMGFDGEYLYNWHQGYGPQGHDITHNLNIGQTWTLPVGKGQRWLHDSSAAVDDVLGGWTFSTETSIHSGLPYSVWAAGNPCPGCPFGIRAIGVSSAFYPSNQSGATTGSCLNNGSNCWLNGAAFANPSTDPTTGVAPQGLEQNQFRGPSFWTTNAALDKTFNVTERLHLELRGEVFNLFNHANLGYPDSSLGDYNPTPSYNNQNLFGTINSIAGYAPNSNAMRYAELALRLSW